MNSAASASASGTFQKPLYIAILCALTALAGGLVHKYMFQHVPAGARMCLKLEDAELKQLVMHTAEGASSGDAARFTALYSDSAIIIGTEKEEWLKGTGEIMSAGVKMMKLQPHFTFTPKEQWIGCTGAWSTGDAQMQWTDPKSAQKKQADYRYTLIYRYEKGAWKIAHMHLSAPEIFG